MHTKDKGRETKFQWSELEKHIVNYVYTYGFLASQSMEKNTFIATPEMNPNQRDSFLSNHGIIYSLPYVLEPQNLTAYVHEEQEPCV